MIAYLNASNFNCHRNAYKPSVLLILLYSLVTCKLRISNTALILLQNKALGTWNSLMQKSGFQKIHHYAGFLQIGSHIHAYIHTYIHTYISTYIYTYIHTYIRIYIRTYVYIHTYIRVCTYTYTYLTTNKK